MTIPVSVNLIKQDLKVLEQDFDRITIFVDNGPKLDEFGKHINKLTKGSLLRAKKSKEFEKKSFGDVLTICFPASLKAD